MKDLSTAITEILEGSGVQINSTKVKTLGELKKALDGFSDDYKIVTYLDPFLVFGEVRIRELTNKRILVSISADSKSLPKL